MHAKVQNLVYKMNNRKSRTESNMFYMEDKGDNISQNVGYNLEMKNIKVSWTSFNISSIGEHIIVNVQIEISGFRRPWEWTEYEEE